MKNQKGFTVIEAMIVIIIISILVLIGLGGKLHSKDPNVTWGAAGMIEERCISGYKFIMSPGGRPEQIKGENGSGVRCDVAESQNPVGPMNIK